MKNKIKLYIESVSKEKGIVIDDNTDLFSAGVLDSLGFIMLLTYLQDEFGIHFTEENMQVENFLCINAIAEFCESLA